MLGDADKETPCSALAWLGGIPKCHLEVQKKEFSGVQEILAIPSLSRSTHKQRFTKLDAKSNVKQTPQTPVSEPNKKGSRIMPLSPVLQAADQGGGHEDKI